LSLDPLQITNGVHRLALSCHLPQQQHNVVARPAIGFQEESTGDARPGSVQVQVVRACVPNRSGAGQSPEDAQATASAPGQEEEGEQGPPIRLAPGEHLAVLLRHGPQQRLSAGAALQRLEQPLQPLGPPRAYFVPVANGHR
jgi:hypothetical protein